MKFGFWVVFPTLLVWTTPALGDDAPEEIIVTADFVEQSLLEIPTSVSVIDAELMAQRQAEHLWEVVGLAPNVSFASGASRGRFFQIRGIGERSQFIDPINPGVGLLIDGIDMSGVGNAAGLFDIQQVEILRGPQGSRYGSNALGGLINLQSNAPTSEFEGSVSGTLGALSENQGTLDTWDLGVVLSGPLTDNWLGRIAFQHYNSDGDIDNLFLGRDDTNEIDQTTLRGRVRWLTSQSTQIDFGLLFVNADNGYDAFTLDNTRDTFSDEPGRDLQRTLAFSTHINHALSDVSQVIALISHATSSIVYSFDEDWVAPGICDGTGNACDAAFWGFSWEYSGFDEYERDRDTTTVEIRFQQESPNQDQLWAIGLYSRIQDVDLARTETFNGFFQSGYQTQHLALFGQYDRNLSERISLSVGGRLENFDADYGDSNGIAFEPDDFSLGGHVTLEYTPSDDLLLYGRVARGFKAGGANSSGSAILSQLSPALLDYETESLMNYELGLKGLFLDGRLQVRGSVFYQDRVDPQIRQSFVDCSSFPCNFTDYVDNAGEASAVGIEAEFNWLATDALELFLNVGLLNAEFDDYLSFSHINADADTGTPFDLSGRALAQSPDYQATLGGTWSIRENLSLWLALESQDDHFFSNRHEAEADAYQLIHARLNYQRDRWSVSLWGNNLANETYVTRGFGSFPNDPRNFYGELGPYVQFGQGRSLGVSARLTF